MSYATSYLLLVKLEVVSSEQVQRSNYQRQVLEYMQKYPFQASRLQFLRSYVFAGLVTQKDIRHAETRSRYLLQPEDDDNSTTDGAPETTPAPEASVSAPSESYLPQVYDDDNNSTTGMPDPAPALTASPSPPGATASLEAPDSPVPILSNAAATVAPAMAPWISSQDGSQYGDDDNSTTDGAPETTPAPEASASVPSGSYLPQVYDDDNSTTGMPGPAPALTASPSPPGATASLEAPDSPVPILSNAAATVAPAMAPWISSQDGSQFGDDDNSTTDGAPETTPAPEASASVPSGSYLPQVYDDDNSTTGMPGPAPALTASPSPPGATASLEAPDSPVPILSNAAATVAPAMAPWISSQDGSQFGDDDNSTTDGAPETTPAPEASASVPSGSYLPQVYDDDNSTTGMPGPAPALTASPSPPGATASLEAPDSPVPILSNAAATVAPAMAPWISSQDGSSGGRQHFHQGSARAPGPWGHNLHSSDAQAAAVSAVASRLPPPEPGSTPVAVSGASGSSAGAGISMASPAPPANTSLPPLPATMLNRLKKRSCRPKQPWGLHPVHVAYVACRAYVVQQSICNASDQTWAHFSMDS